jgi:hypothetical protein
MIVTLVIMMTVVGHDVERRERMTTIERAGAGRPRR